MHTQTTLPTWVRQGVAIATCQTNGHDWRANHHTGHACARCDAIRPDTRAERLARLADPID